jgi:hypothetical protein
MSRCPFSENHVNVWDAEVEMESMIGDVALLYIGYVTSLGIKCSAGFAHILLMCDV